MGVRTMSIDETGEACEAKDIPGIMPPVAPGANFNDRRTLRRAGDVGDDGDAKDWAETANEAVGLRLRISDPPTGASSSEPAAALRPAGSAPVGKESPDRTPGMATPLRNGGPPSPPPLPATRRSD